MKSAHGQMAFDRVDRYKEDGQFKCRKGKACNGRCIPKNAECGDGKGNLAGDVAKGAAAIGGLALAGRAANHGLGGLAKNIAVGSANASRNASNEARSAAKTAKENGMHPDDVKQLEDLAAGHRENAKAVLGAGKTIKAMPGNTITQHTNNQKAGRAVRNFFGGKAK